jgi:hypothetical protein
MSDAQLEDILQYAAAVESIIRRSFVLGPAAFTWSVPQLLFEIVRDWHRLINDSVWLLHALWCTLSPQSHVLRIKTPVFGYNIAFCDSAPALLHPYATLLAAVLMSTDGRAADHDQLAAAAAAAA